MKLQECKVGDRVVAHGTSGFEYPGTIMQVDHNGIHVLWDDTMMIGFAPTEHLEAYRFKLVNDRPSAPPTKHAASRFPHKCPHCGGRAYVGFLSIEHEGDLYGRNECP